MEKKIDELHAKVDKLLIPTPIPVPPTPPVPPIPPVTPSKWVLLNCINWNLNALNNLPLQDATEFTYFVLPVNADGSLKGINPTQETKFVSDVHGAGKKATFSIAGGTNNIADITAAVNQKFNLVNAIKLHVDQFGYDGVTIDIEGTAIDAQAMKDFMVLLRTSLGDKIIGCYIQGYQLNTVWAKLNEYKDVLTWISIMYYDSGLFNLALFNSLNAQLEAKVGKDKVLGGVAVNYPVNNTGLSPEQFGQCLDAINDKGYKGAGLWQNVSYTEPWKQVRRTKFPNI